MARTDGGATVNSGHVKLDVASSTPMSERTVFGHLWDQGISRVIA